MAIPRRNARWPHCDSPACGSKPKSGPIRGVSFWHPGRFRVCKIGHGSSETGEDRRASRGRIHTPCRGCYAHAPVAPGVWRGCGRCPGNLLPSRTRAFFPGRAFGMHGTKNRQEYRPIPPRLALRLHNIHPAATRPLRPTDRGYGGSHEPDHTRRTRPHPASHLAGVGIAAVAAPNHPGRHRRAERPGCHSRQLHPGVPFGGSTGRGDHPRR